MTHTYEYQQTGRFFAQTQEGIEEPGAEELAALGAKNIKLGFRGIFFEADHASLYLINYTSRLISRVLAPLASFRCHNADYLYRKAKGIAWGDFFSPQHTFAIFSHVSHSNIKHSQYAGLRLKDAIADHFTEEYEQRPDIDRTNPDVWVNLHIETDRAIISLDTRGFPSSPGLSRRDSGSPHAGNCGGVRCEVDGVGWFKTALRPDVRLRYPSD
jgi:putative N6-adenine-specific DNA methylase